MTAPGAPQTVLVVDDEPVNRCLAQTILEPAGYGVETAASGAEALAIAAARSIDLVLLDITMPGMTGLEVARRLRADPRTADVAILCVTGLDDPDHRVAALDVGADEFLGKPYTRLELLTRSRLLLSRRQYARELKASLENVERLEAMKDDLVHMLVHDMGNVLAGALGYLELALSAPREQLAAEVARDVNMARECARQLQRMLADVLDLRRLEEGRMPIEPHPFDVAATIEESIEALRGMAGARRKRLRAAPAPGLPKLVADRALIARVIANLVTNAVKYSGKGAEIVVGAELAAGGKIAIYVDDEGPGIAAEVRRRLFEKFATGRSSREAGSERGRGLGLAFCKAAVDAHGGTIAALPREPIGTRFLVELPAAPRAATSPGGEIAAAV